MVENGPCPVSRPASAVLTTFRLLPARPPPLTSLPRVHVNPAGASREVVRGLAKRGWEGERKLRPLPSVDGTTPDALGPEWESHASHGLPFGNSRHGGSRHAS